MIQLTLDPLAVHLHLRLIQSRRDLNGRAHNTAGPSPWPRDGESVPGVHPPGPIKPETHRDQWQLQFRGQIDRPGCQLSPWSAWPVWGDREMFGLRNLQQLFEGCGTSPVRGTAD